MIHDLLQAAGLERTKAERAAKIGSFSADQLGGFQAQGFLWEDVVTNGALRDRVIASDGAAVAMPDFAAVGELACSFDGSHAFFLDYAADGTLLTPVPTGYIVMTPDGLIVADPCRVAEIKWTTKSATMNAERDRPDWFWQAPGYLFGLGRALAQEMTEVEWHVQFPCGDYRGSGVIYEQWRKTYSPQEQWDKWDSLVGHVMDVVKRDRGHRWAAYV